MISNEGSLSEYREDLHQALNDTFLRAALDKFAVAYRVSRKTAFADQDEAALIADVAARKDAAIRSMEELYTRFKAEAEARGVIVHRAPNASKAVEIIARIAADNQCRRIVKSKSMTAEEIGLNPRLEADGCEVVESDLGEWIIQLRHEGPSHMVLPAIHLSRGQVADVFSRVTKEAQEPDIPKLVHVARRVLRRHFAEADMGITGANFAVAETGTLGAVTNEGNLRLTTTLPRVHVALCGLDKLLPTFDDALAMLKVLPPNATGQRLTSYVTWIGGATPCAAPAPVGAPSDAPSGTKIMHVVFVDNGRTALARDPLFAQALRCVRCGACANVCPVYRLVGGHRMGHIYIGAIGLILTYFFHGRARARALAQNCVGCEACKGVCAAGIDLPRLIRELRVRLDSDSRPFEASLLRLVMVNRRLFHSLLRFARYAQLPISQGTPYLRHLPQIFMRTHGFKALPAIAKTPFRDTFASYPQPKNPRLTVALFTGCVQDFVYPEQLDAAMAVFAAVGARVLLPLDQTCCGLPLESMGQRDISLTVARQNIAAFAQEKVDCIVTLCASCASHLKHGYLQLLGGAGEEQQRVAAFAAAITDFSSFATAHLGDNLEALLSRSTEKVAYHAPCHLCRGLNVPPPRALLRACADYSPLPDEDACCGFGGTYSMKFPELSAELLKGKLASLAASHADVLLTDCPGCIIQLRGGAEKQGLACRVAHSAEFIREHLKSDLKSE